MKACVTGFDKGKRDSPGKIMEWVAMPFFRVNSYCATLATTHLQFVSSYKKTETLYLLNNNFSFLAPSSSWNHHFTFCLYDFNYFKYLT